MAKIIGLTGGIGSGKTTIANYFAEMGVPLYIADDEAKKVMQSEKIVKQIKLAFGDSLFENDVLNRAKLAEIVFNDADKLATLNAIVHPAVKEDFELWLLKNKKYHYVIYEAAILFESGRYKDCDVIVTVTAPEEMRIERVVKRDKTTREQVLSRMKMQWDDEKRISLSNFVINNSNLKIAREEVVKILKILNIKQNQS
ncbi:MULTISPECIES: dephospho-CoA kinase [Flavobacterium]|uniref:Dephospho-CoA kinase n=1 Tax=Flavobacterium lipolyticum TaxID=2893754 RepID=A0ABS8M6A6_9FLAO|nr:MULTISPECIES: dephospho-CoA kinase [Flavobacterium]MCC9020322.1 dephospho-CoA kinase [Flavobacterium sp. F-126]OXB21794.1 dephospho-CoA kinase [Flavobacterium tructae]